MQYVALLIIHVYIVIGCSEMGDVSMCRYRRYMYIYGRQRQFMLTTIYADDNSCNMYCRRRQFMQATIYAVTTLEGRVTK